MDKDTTNSQWYPQRWRHDDAQAAVIEGRDSQSVRARTHARTTVVMKYLLDAAVNDGLVQNTNLEQLPWTVASANNYTVYQE